MIIKNFLTKLYISKYYYIFTFLCLITGLIKELLAITILLVFHELGHYIISYLYKWKINNITLYPFGGFIKYDEIIDKPLKEEFFITLAGPLNQLIIFIFIYFLYKNNILSSYFYNIFKNYNNYLLFFNFLPIVPLDGSKLINVLLNKVLSFKISNYIIIMISILSLIIVTILYFNNSYIIILSFLIFEIIKFIKNLKILHNRFILEKYLYNNEYKKRKIIKNINKMMRNKKHIIKYNNMYLCEKEVIRKIKGV